MGQKGSVLLQASFADVEQFCDAVGNWDLDFQPLSANSCNQAVADVFMARYGQVDFGSSRIRSPLTQLGAPPAGRHTFVLLPAAMNDLWWRGRFVSPHDVFVFREGSELSCISGPDFRNYCLSVDEQFVRQVAEREEIRLPALMRRPEVFRLSPPVHARASRLVQECAQPSTTATVSDATEVMEIIVVSWVRQAGIHQGPRQERKRERVLRRSLELIGDGPQEQVTIADLSAAAGASRRTLEMAFQEHLGVGPAAFMKHRRLSGVRRDLKRLGPDDARIGDIMARHGFSHVGQFAADYRQAFGELPSETLAQPNFGAR